MLTHRDVLQKTIQQLLTPGKGILAADESAANIGPKFDSINLESTPETRRQYREHLFETKGCEDYLSGVILHEETFGQKIHGKPCPEYLLDKGIVPGIKVDRGTVAASFSAEEKVTEGLDGLGDRLKEYFTKGARFAKWRAVIQIDVHKPSHMAVHANVELLARYASLCLAHGIVPIVEPEVLADGNHSQETCHKVTRDVLLQLFQTLELYKLPLDLIILKPNMVISGLKHTPATTAAVAQATIDCFKETVPAKIPGIVFLSGGQTEVEATDHLNSMVKDHSDLPWTLSFSYGRALQSSFLKIWQGQESHVHKAQAAFLHRCKMNSLATLGRYEGE
jgi:fructose-bisphosphate aldolase class I